MKTNLKTLIKILGLSFAMGAENNTQTAYDAPCVNNEAADCFFQQTPSSSSQTVQNATFLSTQAPSLDFLDSLEPLVKSDESQDVIRKAADFVIFSCLSVLLGFPILTNCFPSLSEKIKKLNHYAKKPFLTAIEEENVPFAKLTVFCGADITQKNASGKTALDLVTSNPSTAIATFVKNAHIQKFEQEVAFPAALALNQYTQMANPNILGIIQGYLCPETIQNHWAPKRVLPEAPLFSIGVAKKACVNQYKRTLKFFSRTAKKRKNPDLVLFDANFTTEPELKKTKTEEASSRKSTRTESNDQEISSPALKRRRA